MERKSYTMTDLIKVSVVVPVYNSAPYLAQCVDSILSQTLQEIEILFVDDGSTDDSLSLLKAYAAKDSRIQILQQKNLYAGAARNAGLLHASGEYIIFWDSDDYFAPNTLALLYGKITATHADICICDAQDFDNETGKHLFHNYIRRPYPDDGMIDVSIFRDKIFTFSSPVTWNKLIRRSFLREQHIQFQEIKHINDACAIYTALACAKKIALVPEKLIFYRVNRPGSLMATYGNKNDCVFTAYDALATELETRGLLEDPVLKQSFHNKVVNILFFMMPYCNRYEQFQDYYEKARVFLDKLSPESFPDGYLHNADDAEQYRLLHTVCAEDFLFHRFLTLNIKEKAQKNAKLTFKYQCRTLRTELKENKKQLKLTKKQLSASKKSETQLKKKLQQLQASKSYRLAQAFTYLPRRIRALFRRH